MPTGAHAALVADAADVYSHMPGVIGPPATAHAVAQAWAATQGGTPRLAMSQGIYEIEQVTFPTTMPAGGHRLASRHDGDLLRTWGTAFVADTGIPAHDVHGLADRLVAAGEMHLWEDDGVPCCMAATTGATPNGIRVGYVYTPPAKRGHGYASALVATATQQHLDSGRTRCFLYTDLTNPTSNRIYRRLGYRHVADSVEVVIDR
jgi:predicted GNAT family acetyltransferase